MTLQIIKPDWPAPHHVTAFTTTRIGGVSHPPYDQSNFGFSSGDNSDHVTANRNLLLTQFQLPQEPIWIRQTHSDIALTATRENQGKEADATFTDQAHQVCAVLTADCLPLLICNTKGTRVAAIHAGWRGLLNGVIASTFRHLSDENWLAWLGPAIGPHQFEVGAEVRTAFLEKDKAYESAFSPSPNQRWMANIYSIARFQLQKLGIEGVYGGQYCTYSDKENFFSYRRDGNQTGRMVSLIYFSDRGIP